MSPAAWRSVAIYAPIAILALALAAILTGAIIAGVLVTRVVGW